MADDQELENGRMYTQEAARGTNRSANTGRQIEALGDLDDFEVASDFPDPRGWDVVTHDGSKIGKVHELIVDTQALRTRYLDVRLDKDAAQLDDDRDVLIPVGAARLDDDHDNVILDSIGAGQLASLPRYDHDTITRDFEQSVIRGFGPTTSATAGDEDFYRIDHFDDQRFYGSRWNRDRDRADKRERDEARVTRAEEELAIGKRRVRSGEVNLKKHVETEHVSQPVAVKREEVTIDRKPAAEGRTASPPALTEDEIRVPVTEEEIVVDKRPVVKEEIVVKKKAVEDTRTVEADLKKERVEIDDRQRKTRGAKKIDVDDERPRR